MTIYCNHCYQKITGYLPDHIRKYHQAIYIKWKGTNNGRNN